jgi:hypothetical protein
MSVVGEKSDRVREVEAPLEAPLEARGRLIARELWDHTVGQPGRWVLLAAMRGTPLLEDDRATAEAVQFAIDQKWLEEFSGSVRLTDLGRSIR